MVVKFECIGGPFDGRLVDEPPDDEATAFCVVGQDAKGKDTHHFYRLCTIRKTYRGKKFLAVFWHYVGANPERIRKPTLRPPRRLFRAKKS